MALQQIIKAANALLGSETCDMTKILIYFTYTLSTNIECSDKWGRAQWPSGLLRCFGEKQNIPSHALPLKVSSLGTLKQENNTIMC